MPLIGPMDYNSGKPTRLEKITLSSGQTVYYLTNMDNPPAEKKNNTQNQTRNVVRQNNTKNEQPKNIKGEKPDSYARPTFDMQTAEEKFGKFKFEKEEPVLDLSNVPNKPPEPGPEPEFKTEKREEITKYEYLIGLRDIGIKHKQYEPKSIFVSKPMQVEGNVMQVSLNANEEHPIFDELSGVATSRKTSVEYYISYADNPTLDEWYPILPEGIEDVKCELLMFNQGRVAQLRFPALIGSTKTPKVYKDDIKMDDAKWSFVDGGEGVQLLEEIEPTSIYTIDYTPNVEFYNPWTIDVNQQGVNVAKQIDRFPNGTNHNKTVVLSKYPYVNYEVVNNDANYNPNTSSYKPIKVRLRNATIAGPNRTVYKEVVPYDGTDTQKVFTLNKTNYQEDVLEQLQSYSLNKDSQYNGFEYMHEGNKLYFTETFNKADIYTNQETNHGNAEIEVEYDYLVANFRIKIILRRNSSDETTVAPVVHDYALKFKVMK